MTSKKQLLEVHIPEKYRKVPNILIYGISEKHNVESNHQYNMISICFKVEKLLNEELLKVAFPEMWSQDTNSNYFPPTFEFSNSFFS